MFPPTGTGGQVSMNRKLDSRPDSLGQINESNDFNNFRPSVASSGQVDYHNIQIKDQLVNSSPEKSGSTLPTHHLPLAVTFENLTASGKKVQVSHL